jgi:hypothetical protein
MTISISGTQVAVVRQILFALDSSDKDAFGCYQGITTDSRVVAAGSIADKSLPTNTGVGNTPRIPTLVRQRLLTLCFHRVEL